MRQLLAALALVAGAAPFAANGAPAVASRLVPQASAQSPSARTRATPPPPETLPAPEPPARAPTAASLAASAPVPSPPLPKVFTKAQNAHSHSSAPPPQVRRPPEAPASAHPAPSLPLRIASLNLTADEILVDILPPERLVAVTRFADDATMSNVAGRAPATAERFPKADLERLVALRPDLVVVSQFTDGDFLRQLERSGLRAHSMKNLDSLSGIRQAVLDLGRVVGRQTNAETVVRRFDQRLTELEARLAGASRPRVLYWSSPYTAGAGTSLGAIIECGGGKNAAAELGIRGLVPLGAERAFVARPDHILVDPAFESLESLRRHPLLEQLPAVREGRIIALPGAQLSTLSHHLAETCWSVARRLHPDRFE